MIQGKLGDCWLLAALSALATHPGALDKVLVPGQSLRQDRGYCGVFRFRFWQYGDWVEVVIDDQLPCTRNARLAFIHSDSDTEFWSPLLEKAFAKLHGGYASLKGGSTCEALVDFTGGISEVVNLNKPGMSGAELFKLLLKAYNKMSLNCCSIQPDPNIHEARTALGLVKGHAYSITKVTQARLASGGAVRLVRVRNPWGGGAEWRGAWCDGAEEWAGLEEGERDRMGLHFDNDGEYWMEVGDFLNNFDQVEMCHVPGPDRWRVDTWHGQWTRDVSAGGSRNHLDTFVQNPQYFTTLSDPDDLDDDDLCTIIVSLIQKRRRRSAEEDESDDLLSIGFVIYKVKELLPDGGKLDTEFFRTTKSAARSRTFTNTREVTTRFRLTPGQYAIIPSTFRPGHEGEFLLRVFTEKLRRGY